jgi:POT family proton-dependent oligopeptide transporter
MGLAIVGIIITLLTAIPVVLQLRKHPRGLYILFFAEMWERFSYYGMRGLLIFYLTQHFLFNDDAAQGQYAAYGALVYLTPLIGGVLADRFLGTRKAIVFGAILLVAGHTAMAIEGPPASQTLRTGGGEYVFQVEGRMDNRTVKLQVGDGLYDFGRDADGAYRIEGLPADAPLASILPAGEVEIVTEETPPIFRHVLFLAMSLIVMGVGFLKANISSIVGQLYPRSDPRRDPGFTLYYYGINLGAFWAGILCGWLGQSIGWWAGFGLAGVGMLAGLIVFVVGKPMLEGKGEPPAPEALKKPIVGPLSTEWIIYLSAIPLIAIVWVLLQRFDAVGYLLGPASVVILAYVGWVGFTQCNGIERQRLLLALILISASVLFWSLFEQAGSSLNLFAERNTDLTVIGDHAITPAQTQSLNPGFILIFAPVFSAIWAFLGQRGLDPNPVLKFSLALVQVGAGFFVLVAGVSFADGAFQVPLIFLVLAYLLHTTGELCLSPVGLSWMTKLSTAKLISTVMGIWFLAASWSGWLAGLIARLTSAETVGGQVLDPEAALATYAEVFMMIGTWAVVAGLALALASPWLKKLAHGAGGLDDTGSY